MNKLATKIPKFLQVNENPAMTKRKVFFYLGVLVCANIIGSLPALVLAAQVTSHKGLAFAYLMLVGNAGIGLITLAFNWPGDKK